MSKSRVGDISGELRDKIIRMAWADRITFEEIERKTGLPEAEVIRVMRLSLKDRSFRLWRKRVSGRVTKHEKRLRKSTKRVSSSQLENHEME
ncbi:MAG: TIGR03643 family protein [Verrucomicrobiota bacterium]